MIAGNVASQQPQSGEMVLAMLTVAIKRADLAGVQIPTDHDPEQSTALGMLEASKRYRRYLKGMATNNWLALPANDPRWIQADQAHSRVKLNLAWLPQVDKARHAAALSQASCAAAEASAKAALLIEALQCITKVTG